MRLSSFIQLCLYGTLGLCVGAVIVKVMHTDVGRTGGFGGELGILLSPVFFGMAAKRAMHMGKIAGAIALMGLLLAAGGFAAAVSQPAPNTATAAHGRR